MHGNFLFIELLYMNLPNTLSKTLYIKKNGLSNKNEPPNNDSIQLFSSHFDKH